MSIEEPVSVARVPLKKRTNPLATKNRRYVSCGLEYSYEYAHTWVHKEFGDAMYCESSLCVGKSQNFQWSNISREYLLVRSDWQQLCRSCHAKFDVTEATREKQRQNVTGTQKPSRWTNVAKCDPHTGEILETYNCISDAAAVLGIVPSGINNVISGRARKAGGFLWQV